MNKMSSNNSTPRAPHVVTVGATKIVGAFVLAMTVIWGSHQSQAQTSQNEALKDKFKTFADNLSVDKARAIATHNNGRAKPLETFAREMSLFITGKYKPYGLDPLKFYFALPVFPDSKNLEVVEIRDHSLNEELMLPTNRRFFSMNELEASSLISVASPLMKKQDSAPKTLSDKEKDILEIVGQISLLQQIITGDHFLSSTNFSGLENGHGKAPASASTTPSLSQKAKAILEALAAQDAVKADSLMTEFSSESQNQNMPDLFKSYVQNFDLELLYNKLRPFYIVEILLLLIGALFLFPFVQKKYLNTKTFLIAFFSIFIFYVTGFYLRVQISHFAPVTNMFGTMVWVSFGVFFFTSILFYFYRHFWVTGFLYLGSGLILLLTEQIPLILSPDMDPIVAVLRNNFWLSTHVLTITISYAAFTIAMLLGNFVLIKQALFNSVPQEQVKTLSHLAYRAIQLGVFCLTVGIILGGIWADYSWGRFWGWDPKETWALIADLGFLVILHAKMVGYVREFGLLLWSPIAYLLVIMAWYGVNFILAAGLHSYGFSKGGFTAVVSFISLQFAVFAVAALRTWLSTKKTAKN